MFGKILIRVGFVRKDELELKEKKILDLETEIKTLRDLNLQFRLEIASFEERKEHPLINVSAGDPTPREYESRKEYVGTVAGFFRTYLEKKIFSMIADHREQLERIDIPRDGFGKPIVAYSRKEYDLLLKGGINVLWLMHGWGESMVNEQLSYQQGLSEDDLKELKDKAQ